MRKIFTILLSALMVSMLTCGCMVADAGAENNEDEEAVWLYDDSVNYMTVMMRSAAAGDTDALDAAVTARNAKIKEQQLDYKTITTEQFLTNFEYYAGFSLSKDYMADMVGCCLTGDINRGIQAEKARNLKIDALGLDAPKISFNELFLLSKIITAEAGSDWLPMEWKMMVGEVLLNRIASVEFPNTIEECVYQEGQYYNSGSQYFAKLLPYKDCVEAARRLLSGERVINDGSVVFQANFKQGSGTYLKLYDEKLGYTYLCYSNHPELYES